MKSIIYFDNAATSWPKPKTVIQAIQNYLEDIGGSPGRSGHRMSINASRLIEDVRETVANLFACPDNSRIIFTKNVTEALNICFFGLLKPEDHVITSSVEHNSVMRPLRQLEQNGVSLTIVKAYSDGSLDPDEIKKNIKTNTRLIVTTHASNVTGTILPIKEIAFIAAEREVPFLIDCAQTAGALPIDIDLDKSRNCVIAFTGHKSLFGPTGTGGMCIGSDVEVPSFIFGGTGSKSDSDVQPDFLPDRLESGTINIAGLAGLKAGIDFIMERSLTKVRAHELNLITKFLQDVAQIEQIKVYGARNLDRQIGVVSFNLSNLSPSELGLILDRKYNIMCRVGLHCNPNAHKTIGTFPDGTVRFGFSYFNTIEQVEFSIQALREIAEMNQVD